MNIKKDLGDIKSDRIILGAFILILTVVLIIIYFSTEYINRYTNLIQKNIEDRLLAECRAIQYMVSVDQLQSYLVPEDMEREDYKKLRNMLTNYAEENNLTFIYYMRQADGGQVQYIIDSDPDPESNLGLDYYEAPYYLAEEAFNGKPVYSLIGEYE
jgi:CHASE3 domain sensor protein